MNGIASGTGSSTGNADSGIPLCLGGRNESYTPLDDFICAVLTFDSALAVADRQTSENSHGVYLATPGFSSTWSNPANWAATSGGPGGASVRTAATPVHFDSNPIRNCPVYIAADAASITMDSGYSGTLAFGTNTLTVAGSADLR